MNQEDATRGLKETVNDWKTANKIISELHDEMTKMNNRITSLETKVDKITTSLTEIQSDVHDEESPSELFDIDVIKCDHNKDDGYMTIKARAVNVSTYSFESVKFILGVKDASGKIIDFVGCYEFDIHPDATRSLDEDIDMEDSSKIHSCFVEVESYEMKS